MSEHRIPNKGSVGSIHKAGDGTFYLTPEFTPNGVLPARIRDSKRAKRGLPILRPDLRPLPAYEEPPEPPAHDTHRNTLPDGTIVEWHWQDARWMLARIVEPPS